MDKEHRAGRGGAAAAGPAHLFKLRGHGPSPVGARQDQRAQVELVVRGERERLPEARRLLCEHPHAPVGLDQAAVDLEIRVELLLVLDELHDHGGRRRTVTARTRRLHLTAQPTRPTARGLRRALGASLAAGA